MMSSRSRSPSPTGFPTPALSAVPELDRSVSESSSTASIATQDSQGDVASRRRGYMRPQATVFADSARNRDSVMCLGTIAHLQYYFARTGLLDGKGAQFAREDKDGRPKKPAIEPSVISFDGTIPDPFVPQPMETYADSSISIDRSTCSTPEDELPVLTLPPTVSTYKEKPTYVAPPPDLMVLRRELREALEDAKKVLREIECNNLPENQSTPDTTPTKSGGPLTSGWHEVEGLHVLDLITLAIKAAKNYYSCHEQPQRIHSIRSEKQIRSDFHKVLETLQRAAGRNFKGGYRKTEVADMSEWLGSIEHLLNEDEAAERREQEKRQGWTWLGGNWTGHEREREWLFLKSFDSSTQPLPAWLEPSEENRVPGSFLLAMADGRALCRLHNELVRSSGRRFGEINTYHQDVAKPYRRADNLRFWIKAAELRWDTFLNVDVSGVVNSNGLDAWHKFDSAILSWCQAVREELSREWIHHNGGPQHEKQPSASIVEPVGWTMSQW